MNAALLLLSSTLGVGADAPGPGCTGGDCVKAVAPACGDCDAAPKGGLFGRLFKPKSPCHGCGGGRPPTSLFDAIKGRKHGKAAAECPADPCPTGCGAATPAPPPAPTGTPPAEMTPAKDPPKTLPPKSDAPPKGSASAPPAVPVTPVSGPRLNGPHSPY